MKKIYIETWYNDGKSQLLGTDGTSVLKDDIGTKALDNAIKLKMDGLKLLSVKVKPFLKDGFILLKVVDSKGKEIKIKKFNIE